VWWRDPSIGDECFLAIERARTNLHHRPLTIPPPTPTHPHTHTHTRQRTQAEASLKKQRATLSQPVWNPKDFTRKRALLGCEGTKLPANVKQAFATSTSTTKPLATPTLRVRVPPAPGVLLERGDAAGAAAAAASWEVLAADYAGAWVCVFA
jgi:hypothetical protein